jgi:hypothetical protein
MNVDIKLAWSRVQNDLKNKHFISPLFLPDILRVDIDNWLSELKIKVENKLYQYHPMEIIEIPKGNGLIRPGSLLSIDDNIVYAALVQECYINVFARIEWAQNEVDFAYIIHPDNLKTNNFYKKQLLCWNLFREQSLKKIDEGFMYVVVTDLASYYDNIDLSILNSDLKTCGIDNEIVAELSKCLNKWAQVNGRGIPQSNSASDLLAKLYLDNIDVGLKNAGFTHLRYVDDIRIFCRTRNEAKRALIELSRLIRKRGLSLQSSKTNILPAADAIFQIEGVQPVIKMISSNLFEKEISFQVGSSYFEETDLTSEETVDDASIEVIREVFNTYFINGTKEQFNKTLFHYLINRLISEHDSFAFEYCLANFENHPEETEYLLKYSKSFDAFDIDVMDYPEKMINFLLNFLDSKSSVYDYQNYQILLWLSVNQKGVPDKLVVIARKFAFDNNLPYYIRSVSRKILGDFGNSADFDKLEDQLMRTNMDYERAELLCCLKNIEKGKRNSLLGRVINDGEITKMAVSFVKSLNNN